ncbi:peptidoglycan DD-metalloendopeptidase family protein [Photobacterium lutimaris]|uniref:Peptidase M23 n=1 Tax=Photobacterium lutimaris TaxID=388278 RepID=A0A2T3IWW3_9GAMM|nr:peptidoglycan DD-metalloendopeptidase family protein [Photobacterium lutimaris]PSU32986.1 peptidase M23 [Photobacterium lutimaris]TDR74028.1 septal ring factor EnvC (AmiA/AmiB activator) [Photobacterium lutimaris]
MREVIKHLHQRLRASAFCTGALLCLLFSSHTLANDSQLKGVKQEISRQQDQVAANRKKVDQLQKSLRQQEVGIAETAKAIHQAEARSGELSTSIRSLRQQLEQLRQQQLGQQELLKELLNAHYKQGKQSQLALMLSGEDSSQLDRFTVYAERLSQARSRALDELAATTTELQLKQHQLGEQQNEQQALLAKLNEQKRKLESERSQRQKTVRNLRGQLTSDSQYLTELKQNEQRLVKEIEKARAAAEAARRVPMDGLAKQKGKLPWPVKGKILHRYGTSQQGELHWKGMVIAQSTGNPVKAIYPGKVVFADWLRGYGLVLAVDHGKGDMSFYGYNQTLLKKVGDTVQANENIALIGDSGGQDQSSLYFEIRRKGSPTNPSSWLTR